MSCCPDINDIFSDQFTEVTYDTLVNLDNTDGVLTRNGGVIGSSDAFARTSEWVDGDGCAMWWWTVRNNFTFPSGTVDNECNLINYYIIPEDPVSGVYGWGFTNQLVSFRRSPFLNSIPQFPIYFRNFDLGYNRFGIYYNNGEVWLLETAEFNLEDPMADPGWIGPPSYGDFTLPTTTRWRLQVVVKNSAALCQSSVVKEFIGTPAPCGGATWFIPPIVWSASIANEGPQPPPEIETCTPAEAEDQIYPRVQRVVDFRQEIHRNMQLQISSVAPLTLYGYSMDWVPVSVSELTEQRNSYGASWQFAEYGHLFYCYINYISNSDLTLTVNTDLGTEDTYTLPSSEGIPLKKWVILAARKAKLFDLKIAGVREFQIIPSQSVLFGKEYKESSYRQLNCFGDQT